ncbi:uncharacterized protein [Diadema setosum]|uniref:uncharacterized protein n=1 Tax=Diadema setosum TaxID=31175 RepID=UPI003B3A6451
MKHLFLLVVALEIGLVLVSEGEAAAHGSRHGDHGDGNGVGHGPGKGVRMHPSSCVVADIVTHPEFSLLQYEGTWFTVAHADASGAPFHRRSHYALSEDGSLGMTTQRISQDGCESSVQFEADAFIPEGSAISSKLLLQPRGVDVLPEDYWVIYTDYVDHALVYSCNLLDSDGTCAEGADHVWFLSRRGELTRRARRHMMSLLADLCVDRARMVDVPTDCDAQLGVPSDPAHEERMCPVDDIQTMANFDMEQYTGTWYVIAHMQERMYPYHRISQYTVNEGSLDMVTHRVSSPNECDSAWKFHGVAYIPEESDTDSKMVLKPFGMPVYGEDYWIIYTDYTDHSLVYSCVEHDSRGACQDGSAHAWLMSRSPTLSVEARTHMEGLLEEMCVDTRGLMDTPLECDETLESAALTDEDTANECAVQSLPTMQTFDKQKFAGRWYITSHLPNSDSNPYQRFTDLTLEEDGSITMATQSVFNGGEDACQPQREEYVIQEQEQSPSPARLMLLRRGIDTDARVDFWVVHTDYVDHALIYSCGVTELDGTCQEGQVTVQLLSRRLTMSGVARSHLLSILEGLCVDPAQLRDIPDACDTSLGISVEERCSVSNFEVMENFDSSRYVGTWYVISHLQRNIYPYHRVSTYETSSEDGSITMTTRRISSPESCTSAMSFQARATIGSDVSAKMQLTPMGIPGAIAEDYWVVYTDYMDHALVYSCGARTPNGTCREGEAHAWMMSRDSILSEEAHHHMTMLLHGLCVDPAQMVDTPPDCDPFLYPGMRLPEELSGSCAVDNFRVMDDFNLEQYAGQWYTVAQVQPPRMPYHRVSTYTLQANNTLKMSTDQYMRPGDCTTAHLDAEAFYDPASQIPGSAGHDGKLILRPHNPAIPPGRYWVVDTNYTEYALVYSCLRWSEGEACLPRFTFVWFLSRRPTLTADVRQHMMSFLPSLCVDPALLRDVHATPAPVSCSVDGFSVKQDLVIEKFLGNWYEVSHTNGETNLAVPDMEMISFSPSSSSRADLSVIMLNLRMNGECFHRNMKGKGWLSDIDASKIVVSFPLPAGYDVPEVVNYWILDTDYDHYAITYTCHRLYEDGSCDPSSQGLWILGRQQEIDAQFWPRIKEVVESACVSFSGIIPSSDPCPGYTVRDRADPRPCASTEFGCCLLNDDPAADSSYSNCPRVPPPVAGRNVPEAPVTVVEGAARTCDQRITCKMFCRFGFARDEDNCEICLCAPEPRVRGACQLRHSVVMNKLKNRPPRNGFYIPQCNADGNYETLQCLHPMNACWCADTLSGKRLRKARYDGNMPSCDP